MPVVAIERFEDIVAWQKARALNLAIYEATRATPFSRDFGLASQIQRAAISVMANIAEGFERNRPGELHQALSISKASCAEVRSHLYAALDLGYLNQADFNRLKQQAEEVSRVVGGFRSSVQRRRDREG